uniref:Leucine-rich repeat-containing N-terminal plant-type domain-containing protein n=1 Tax=Leersia perrieri TaxID=77586 RepID=A0A0D9V2M0_9ORYZ
MCENLVYLDLAYNQFSGSLPVWVGKLSASLALLRLRPNMFSGHIPVELTTLQSLDLSYDEFFGAIPSSVSALTSLSFMNLSYNNLSGNIPTGNQLQTLDNPKFIYIGNIGLCGPPLANACPGDAATTPSYPTQQQHEIKMSSHSNSP